MGTTKENARQTVCGDLSLFDRCSIILGVYACSTKLICDTAGSSGECCGTDDCNDPNSITTTAKSTSSKDNKNIVFIISSFAYYIVISNSKLSNIYLSSLKVILNLKSVTRRTLVEQYPPQLHVMMRRTFAMN